MVRKNPGVYSPADDAREQAESRLTKREVERIEREVELIGQVVDQLMRDSAKFRIKHMKWRARQAIAKADRATGRR